jgi:uncharacterized protein YbjT (DUF2867 family)
MLQTVAVAGGTGLVGGLLLAELIGRADVGRILCLGRRAPRETSVPQARIEFRRVDFQHLETEPAEAALSIAFCALGTTIRVAGSREAFRAVDFDAVVAFARWAKRGGADRFVLVSAMGADATSRVFYNRIKGETEAAVRALFPAATILRPSLLDGPRTEVRTGERIGLAVSRVLRPLLPRNLRPIAAADVARAMTRVASAGQPPRLLLSGDIARWGKAETRFES